MWCLPHAPHTLALFFAFLSFPSPIFVIVPFRLPLFPLPTVLLPGTRMPLHIFEPRYRRMVRACLDADRMFGLIYRPEELSDGELPAGHVGCRAYIDEVEPMADGRSNIIVSGRERFTLVRVIRDEAPYDIGEVEPLEDEREPIAQLMALSLRLHELFVEAAHAARALADEPAPMPVLPDDPNAVAFAAAASIDLGHAQRQKLLSSPSPSERMRDVIRVLDASLPELAARAQMHNRAKLNGHGPHGIAE
jgi:Lon protease-like protein